MKTIRISRQGFTNIGMHSWLRYFIFILTKKYNVIVDPINPDIVFFSNIHCSEGQEDTFLKTPLKMHDRNDTSKKFVFVSGEISDFQAVVDYGENHWVLGYSHIDHPRYFRLPSYVIDTWVLFDEARMFDTPFGWLTEKRDYNKIKSQFNSQYSGFASVTQNSSVDFRGRVFDILEKHKPVTSSGPWRQNVEAQGVPGLDRHQWQNVLFTGRIDGLTYREKIEFFKRYKFNITVQLTNTDYVTQEKLIHAYAANTIPLFYGNQFIEQEGFNPNTFINLHKYEHLDDFLEDVIRIDTDESVHRSYIEEPIFAGNKLPDYFDFDNVLSFLEKVVES